VFGSVGLDGTHLFALVEHVEGWGVLDGEYGSVCLRVWVWMGHTSSPLWNT
jgi:hypothetical protein